MTTIAYAPQTNQAFTFTATLDGNQYTVTVPINLYALLPYIVIQQQNGTVVLWRYLTASPPNYSFNLVAGYFFTSTMIFQAETQNFVITP